MLLEVGIPEKQSWLCRQKYIVKSSDPVFERSRYFLSPTGGRHKVPLNVVYSSMVHSVSYDLHTTFSIVSCKEKKAKWLELYCK